MPNWQKLLENYVLFKNIISAAPYTAASDNTLMTGLYPFSHGQTAWLEQSYDVISKNTPTIQWILKSLGYKTFYLSEYFDSQK